MCVCNIAREKCGEIEGGSKERKNLGTLELSNPKLSTLVNWHLT